jgi:putative copper resistance protein D
VLEAAVVAARLLQYSGAAILFGSSLFCAFALPPRTLLPGARALVAGGALMLCFASLGLIGAQASLFAGSFHDGLTREALGAVASEMDLGRAALVRAAVAAIAFVAALSASPRRPRWLALAGLGAVAAASLAWLGHAAASEGPLAPWQLIADVVHVLAACAWIGALAGFLLLARAGSRDHGRRLLYRALAGFAGAGSVLVALLLMTGLANALFLVGPDHLGDVWATDYGRALAIKLALFAVMLLLAANNRWRLTPALARLPGPAAAGALRRSIAIEALAGFGVLGAVAWLGTLPPPALV